MAPPLSIREEALTYSRKAWAAKMAPMAQFHRQHGLISSATIIEMFIQLDITTRHNVPLHNDDLSALPTNNMRLSLSPGCDSMPYVAPLLDFATFNGHFMESYMNRNRDVMPSTLPPAMTQLDDPLYPAFCYGWLFHIAHKSFCIGAIQFFWDHSEGIMSHNPDLTLERRTLAPDHTGAYHESLDNGQRNGEGQLIWKAWSGFTADGLEAIIMNSGSSGTAFIDGGGNGGVAKAELLVMLLQFADMAE